MKKTAFLIGILFLVSCSTPGRTCGGGRKRCVQIEKNISNKKSEKIS